jgi:stage II sporulation protein R
MKRHLRRIALVLIAAFGIGLWGLMSDSRALYEGLLRLHVVGASNTREDQQVKLRVRDAVLGSLEQGLQDLTDASLAMDYVRRMLPQVEAAANRCLAEAGMEQTVSVSLGEEAFPTRQYDTFSLPAGIYKALRVVIGEGAGRNWWCVVFPSLCLPATTEGFADTAAGAGFSDTLTDTLQQEDGYEFRFFFLDCLGWLQNLFSAA